MGLLRLPLWLLPGPGRDEAAYYYWAHHIVPAYALLMQLSVRLTEQLTGHSLWALRLPVLLLGLVVILLNDRRLAGTRSLPAMRLLAALALALCPWQTYAAAVLHPDNFLLAALLGLVLAVQKNRLWLTFLAAVAALLAKPTGALALPVAWLLCGRMVGIQARELWTARGVLLGTGLVFVLILDPGMAAGLADFGRFSPSLTWYQKGAGAGSSLLFLGGPLLLGMSWFGVRQRIGTVRQGGSDETTREAWAALAMAGILLAVFLAALVLRGQFKGNWILPAVILLWPARSPFSRSDLRKKAKGIRMLALTGLLLTFLPSLAQTAVLVRPGLVDRLEESLDRRGLVPRWATYRAQAGVREASVSAHRTWGDHLRGFGNLSRFAEAIRCGWRGTAGSDAPLKWVLSSDYGLAFQLSWYLQDLAPRVAVCGDDVFAATWAGLEEAAPDGALLALSAREVEHFPGTHWRIGKELPAVPHPVTGQTLHPVLVYRTRFSDKKGLP